MQCGDNDDCEAHWYPSYPKNFPSLLFRHSRVRPPATTDLPLLLLQYPALFVYNGSHHHSTAADIQNNDDQLHLIIVHGANKNEQRR